MPTDTRWFRVPSETFETTDSDGNVISSYTGPKYSENTGIDGYSGNTIGNSPQWIVRFYGDSAALDDIAAKSDATELTDSEAAQKFADATTGNLPDSGWDASTVNNRFEV